MRVRKKTDCQQKIGRSFALWTGLSQAREKSVWLAGCLRDVDPLCGSLLLDQWPAPGQATRVRASEAERPAQSGASLTQSSE